MAWRRHTAWVEGMGGLGVAGGWAGLDDHDFHLCRTPTAGSKGLEQGALTLLFDDGVLDTS